MTPDIETLIDDLTRLKRLLPLLSRLTVRDIIEAGDEAIEAAAKAMDALAAKCRAYAEPEPGR